MEDWRIKYYFDTAISEKNKRIIDKFGGNHKLVKEDWAVSKYRALKKENPKLNKVEVLKLLCKKIKEGSYD